MSPVFCYDTTAVTDVQWFSASETQPTITNTQRRFADTSVYSSGYNYNKSREVKRETRKERIARQSSAFKMFYGIPQFEVRKSKKDKVAQQKEVSGRIDKFKGLNSNLIL